MKSTLSDRRVAGLHWVALWCIFWICSTNDPTHLNFGIIHSRSLNGGLLIHSFCCLTVTVASYVEIDVSFRSRGCGYMWSNHVSGLPYNKIVITVVECDTRKYHEFIAEYCYECEAWVTIRKAMNKWRIQKFIKEHAWQLACETFYGHSHFYQPWLPICDRIWHKGGTMRKMWNFGTSQSVTNSRLQGESMYQCSCP